MPMTETKAPDPEYGSVAWWTQRATAAQLDPKRKVAVGVYCCPYVAKVGPDTGNCDHPYIDDDVIVEAHGLTGTYCWTGREPIGTGIREMVRA